MVRRLSLFFTIVLLLSHLVEAFHYHDDGADHPDCSICATINQQADSAYNLPVYQILPQAVKTPYPQQPVLPTVAKSIYSPFNNRAPPS